MLFRKLKQAAAWCDDVYFFACLALFAYMPLVWRSETTTWLGLASKAPLWITCSEEQIRDAEKHFKWYLFLRISAVRILLA
jgi:hypothetical protein